MKRLNYALVLIALIATLVSCTSTPAGKTNIKDTTVHAPVTAPVVIDTPKYHSGQFVYIWGRVKARIQWVDHQIPGCGCGGSDKVNYWVYHINTLNEIGTIKSGWGTVEELFPTRDIDTVYVIHSDDSIRHDLEQIKRHIKTVFDNQLEEMDRLHDLKRVKDGDIDSYMKREIKNAVQNHD